MTLAGGGSPNYRELAEDLIALLEREKRRGREFLRLGEAGRRALTVLEGKTGSGLLIEEVNGQIRQCRRCPLGFERSRTVPGEGPHGAAIMVVGEGPGEEEDRTGRPFVGAAGELLTRMLQAIDLPRGQVYIGNVIKCRPPENRAPAPDEIQACFPFLQEQIRIIQPRLLVALGGVAARALTRTEKKISELRGKSFTFDGRLVIPTYHPAYLLRSPEFKREAWEDLKKIRRELDRLNGE